MKANELRCCPFCGSHEVEVARTNKNACWIECDACGASAKSAPTRNRAFANWNRRYHDDVPATIVEDMDKDRKAKK